MRGSLGEIGSVLISMATLATLGALVTAIRPVGGDDIRALGSKIRQIRKAAGRTLEDLAGNAGISRSMLSQIERGGAHPSIHTLRGIANALNLPIAVLFLEPGREALDTVHDLANEVVVRRKGRRGLKVPDSRVLYEL